MRGAAISAVMFVAACSPFGAGTSGTDTDAAPLDAATGDAGIVPDAAGLTYREVVIADDPVAYFRLGDVGPVTSTKSVVANFKCDFVGNPTVGVKGAIAGDSDTAFELDGTTAGLNCGTNFDFTKTSPFSLEIWMRADVVDGNFRHLFAKEVAPATGKDNYGVLVNNGTEKGLYFERYILGGGAGAYAKTFVAGPAFHHVVAVYTGAFLQLYLDGTLVEQTPDVRPSVTKEVPTYVGMKAPGAGFFKGAIDEVAIYRKALTSAQIATHYAVGTRP